MEAHGVEAQDEHFISTLNEWANWENELGCPTIPKELCGGKSIGLGGPFGAGWVLLQQFKALYNRGHTFSNGDRQVIKHAYDLGHKWATPKWCKWGSANGHATWWEKVALVGDGQNQYSKCTKTIQGFCKQVLTRGDFE
jgi:hypothetical protein